MQINTNGTDLDLSYFYSNSLMSARVAEVQMRTDLPLNFFIVHNDTSLCMCSIESRTSFCKIEEGIDICNLIPAHGSSCFSSYFYKHSYVKQKNTSK